MPIQGLPPRRCDVVVVGGGHNGLVAAAYLAKAGLEVVVLERAGAVGGASVSEETFPGVPARLSRYSYLVSLMPERIRRDLGVSVELIRRRFSSYTPQPGGSGGLLIDTQDPERTRQSFSSIGASADYEAWSEFYRQTAALARIVFPTVLDPLCTRRELAALVAQQHGKTLWDRFIETPIEHLVGESFSNDLVQGVVLTDALIGTFPRLPQDPATSICFLYHVIGGGTGDWDVPRGGMGAVSGALARAADSAGATIITDAEVTRIDPEGEVTANIRGDEVTIAAQRIVSGVARVELERLISGQPIGPLIGGAQVKVNLVVDRLPQLRDHTVRPEEAFAGTFHVNEMRSQLDQSISQAQSGILPETIPCEIYCHSLTDDTILGQSLIDRGAHTLTIFALNTPHELIAHGSADSVREDLQQRVLRSLNSVLGEPIEGCVTLDSDGKPCIETKTTADLETSLRLPGGNIFHEPLRWPFAEEQDDLSTPAKRWGVDTGWRHVVFAGSSAQRGGGVSGIGGHNAAMATLESLGLV